MILPGRYIKASWFTMLVLSVVSILLYELKPNLFDIWIVYTLISISILFTFLLPSAFYSLIVKYSYRVFAVFLIMIILHVYLNVINIYEVVKSPRIVGLCITNQSICTASTQLFYSFKLFRFITLSPYFFVSFIFLLFGTVGIRPIANQLSFAKLRKLSALKQVFLVILLVIIIFNGLQIFSKSFSEFMKSVAVMRDPFNERYINKMGGNNSHGWIYTYAAFVRDVIPQDAVVFIPPQTESWRMEGNMWFMRYFLYPRVLIAAEAIDATPPETAEYVLIAHGAWIGEKDHVWPKVTIPLENIEEITTISRDNLTTSLHLGEYTPNYETETWGVIKLKK